jgi:UDP-glucose:tetrahydrobiopterin glucosyltransferase
MVRHYGIVQDHGYWAHVLASHPDAPIHLEGFLPTDELQARLGRARAVLMTPRWVEAFGNVAIEALACGVPVIAYARGGPAEIITDGETGFVVAADDVDGVIDAVGRLDEIDRRACRKRAEQEYSVEAMGARVEAWLLEILG